MSDERDREELELEALQRRLDDAFETTRPRRGFEDELWLRMQARRGLGDRLRDAFAGLVAGVRQAPAVPIAAVALVLVAVIGVSVLNYSGLSPAGGHKQESTAAGTGGVPASRNDTYYAGGQIPSPALHPGLVDTQAPAAAAQPGAPQPPPAAGNLYYGPANLTWTGSFQADIVNAPVLVYGEPTQAQMKAAAGGLGPLAGVNSVQTRGSVPQLPLEPLLFVRGPSPAATTPVTDAVQTATGLLQRYNLLPAWPYNAVEIPSGPVTRVIFQRAFPVQDGEIAYLVDWTGERYGAEVDLGDGQWTATVPVPLTMQSVGLPLISNSDAARLAISQAPASAAAITPAPTIALDHVELVYALAIAHGNGYYEPAYLFSGTFTYNGQTYVKRVLVPLVVPSLRS